jgi:hypothetical protein
MFIFVVQTLQNKWNEICIKQLAGRKHMENDCFPRTLKFEMYKSSLSLDNHVFDPNLYYYVYSSSDHCLVFIKSCVPNSLILLALEGSWVNLQ